MGRVLQISLLKGLASDIYQMLRYTPDFYNSEKVQRYISIRVNEQMRKGLELGASSMFLSMSDLVASGCRDLLQAVLKRRQLELPEALLASLQSYENGFYSFWSL
ncbi:MAG: hypothetical protein EAX81_07175 [Candidatus Thorarchaeota archaeon]|nr:hypothetical protein [Candidatus Thorarchaeota archaeon]